MLPLTVFATYASIGPSSLLSMRTSTTPGETMSQALLSIWLIFHASVYLQILIFCLSLCHYSISFICHLVRHFTSQLISIYQGYAHPSFNFNFLLILFHYYHHLFIYVCAALYIASTSFISSLGYLRPSIIIMFTFVM